MSILTQILLLVSYAVLALAVAILPPRLWGMDQQIAFMLGLFIFLVAWQINIWLRSLRSEDISRRRLDKLEDSSLLLRSDMTRMKRSFERQAGAGSGNVGQLESELRLLHTLMDQVMEREARLEEDIAAQKEALEAQASAYSEVQAAHVAAAAEAASGSDIVAWSDEDGDMVSVHSAQQAGGSAVEGPEAFLEHATSQGLAGAGHAGKPRSVDKIFASEAEGVVGERLPAATQPENASQVRMIDDYETLLRVIRSSLSENRVDLYLQPTVRLPARQTAHFECFSRVRDEEGRVLLPRQYMAAAEELQLAGTLDNLLLFRLIQLLRRLGARQPDMRFFCNLGLFSMQDEEFFPQFVDFMLANPEFSGRMVFEISQADLMHLPRDVADKLQTLGRRGFGFCLDQVENLDQLDLGWLEKHFFRFVKIDWRYLLDAFGDAEVGLFIQRLRSKGLQLIAARIETEEQAISIAETGLELAQGYIYGQPAVSQHFASQF